MIEREDIINSIQKNLWEVEGIALVERNLRQLPTVAVFPAVFIMDLGDEVDTPLARPVPEYKRRWRICLVSLVQGTTEEAAIKELAAFQMDVKWAVYATGKMVGSKYRGYITERTIEPLEFLSIGNNVVAQGIVFEIFYVQSQSNY